MHQARVRIHAKGWAAVLSFGVIRRNELDQCSSGNHEFHLGEQPLLAGLLGAQVQIKAALLHGLRGCHCLLTCTKHGGRF